ncbi:MAG: hypothetical protein LLG04_17650 [Parachlamydia sp.]|nr:hypothetical protein [Parachlamydia sp.]
MREIKSKKVNLSPAVSKAFGNFIVYTNFSHHGRININTWEALYDFIEYTHAHHIRLGEDQLTELLLAEGASLEDADEVANVYFHCRNLLYRKRPWDVLRMHSWLRTRKEKENIIQGFFERVSKNT